jgi:hypothetical protein
MKNFGQISPEKMESLKANLLDMFDLQSKAAETGLEQFDYDKCFNVTALAIGRFYTEVNGLIWRERTILAEMESQQAINKKQALHGIKLDTKFRLENSKEIETWIYADDSVNGQEVQIKKVKATIEFLEKCLEQAAYFSNNVKNLLEIRKQQRDLFGQ